MRKDYTNRWTRDYSSPRRSDVSLIESMPPIACERCQVTNESNSVSASPHTEIMVSQIDQVFIV